MPTFDPRKDALNLARHGMSLSEADGFDWTTALIEEDRSEAYGEQRHRAIGFVGHALCVYVYTERDNEERAISLRRATRMEAKIYAQAL